jgi:hypothetical protein
MASALPLVVYFLVPVCSIALTPRTQRRAGFAWAGVYWVSGAILHLALPLLTGVARWESDLLDLTTMRSVSYVPETIAALLWFQTGVAITIGMLVAAVLARGSGTAVVILVGAVAPLALEAAADWRWFSYWCRTMLAFLVTWPDSPEWLGPITSSMVVGVSYLLPPAVAGVLSATVALWSTRWRRGRRTRA